MLTITNDTRPQVQRVRDDANGQFVARTTAMAAVLSYLASVMTPYGPAVRSADVLTAKGFAVKRRTTKSELRARHQAKLFGLIRS